MTTATCSAFVAAPLGFSFSDYCGSKSLLFFRLGPAHPVPAPLLSSSTIIPQSSSFPSNAPCPLRPSFPSPPHFMSRHSHSVRSPLLWPSGGRVNPPQTQVLPPRRPVLIGFLPPVIQLRGQEWCGWWSGGT